MQTVVLEKIVTPQEFIMEINRLVEVDGVDYIDAVVHFCQKYELEIETAAAMIKSDPKIKSKMQSEFEILNYLPKRAKLPL